MMKEGKFVFKVTIIGNPQRQQAKQATSYGT